MKRYINKGISIIEVLVVIAILVGIIAVVTPSLSAFRNQQLLTNTAEDIVSLLNQARTRTLSSENSTYYSVHFETGRAVLFTGNTFSSGASTNISISANTLVMISGINLTGGGANVTFTRLTGDTAQDGTIVVSLVSDPSKTKTITINKTGIASVH